MHRYLVFLHGFGANGKIWGSQIKNLSNEHQMLAPDLDLSDLELEAKKLADLCNKETVIIAWSLGAFLALKMYVQIPEKIKALILVGATAKFIQDETFPAGLSPALFRNLERKLQRNYTQGMQFFYALIGVPKNFEGLTPPEYETALKCLEELKKSDVRDLLPKIACPTLIIHGKLDQICPLSAAEYLHRRIPNSKLVVFEKAGHAPFISEAEKFKEVIKDFISGPL